MSKRNRMRSLIGMYLMISWISIGGCAVKSLAAGPQIVSVSEASSENESLLEESGKIASLWQQFQDLQFEIKVLIGLVAAIIVCSIILIKIIMDNREE
ncbi:MAG: hypothetical protein ACI4C1_05530 [Lachnospiraceae bacterium]